MASAVGAPGGTGHGDREQSKQGLGYVWSRRWETPWGVQGWVKCDTPGCFPGDQELWFEVRSLGPQEGDC